MIQRSLDAYRLLVQFAPDALVIVDDDGCIRAANAKTEEMFGYAPRELLDQPIETLVPERSRGEHRRLRESYASHPHPRPMSAMRDLYGRRKDGTTFPVEISLSPLEADSVRLFCAGIRDVTDRVAMAASLRASEERFRTLVDQSSDGIFITDTDGRYQDVNPAGCHMLGYTRDELLGMSIADIVEPTDVPRIASEVARLESGAPAKSEWQFRCKDGSTFFGEVNARRLSDSRLLANVRDISARRKVEDELRASKHFIEAVATASPPLIYVFDLDESRLTYINRSLLTQLGYSPANHDHRLDEFRALMLPGNETHLARVVEEWRGLQDGQLREDEYRLNDAGGGVHWFQGRETVFARRDDGSVGQVLGTLYDVTTRKLAEQALDHSRALLQSFVEHTPAAVAMFDRNLCYLAVSRRWLHDYGLGDRDVIGRHHYDVFPEIRNMPDWIDVHQRCLAGAVVRRDEDQFVRANGRTDWLRWEVRPWRDEAGDIGGIIMFTEVTTDRKVAEARLRESQVHLVASQHVARVGSWEFDVPIPDDRRKHSRVRWSDECFRIFGYRTGEVAVTRETFFERVHPEDKAALQDAVRNAIEHGTAFSLDHRIGLSDGSERIVHQQADVVMNPATGKPSKLIGTVQDVTDRVRLEERLRQSQKLQAIGQLAGGIAHDFNNILTVIGGVTETLLDQLASGSKMRDDILAIRDAADRAASLTQQLLLFSRKAVLQPRRLDCNAIVMRMSRLLRRLIGAHIVLSTELAPALAPVKADPTQIEQMLMNLVLNARDAMPRGGRLRIETRNVSFSAEDCRAHPEYSEGRYVHVLVGDTGSGMPAHVKAHLFEPFFTTKGAGRGTGLGLATVYGITQQLGGFITVSSEVGAGSTFNLFFPAANADEPISLPPGADTRDLRGHETVLLVEDDAAVRQLTRAILEKYGYTVLEAEDGETALRISGSRAQDLDLVLTDVMLPQMSGPDLATALLARRPHTPVLFMSGYEEGLIAQGPYQVAGPFIQKPFLPKELAARVRAVLDSRTGDTATVTE